MRETIERVGGKSAIVRRTLTDDNGRIVIREDMTPEEADETGKRLIMAADIRNIRSSEKGR